MTAPARGLQNGLTYGQSPDQAGVAAMPPEGKAALRAGVVGNWIDNIHVFLPVTALAPAMLVLAGPAATASTGALIIVAMLFGRPVGGIVFGRISDRLGRTRTTRIAIAGTAACALAIAAMPTHELLGAGTVALILALRFLGGIFVAGEYSAAIPLAMEWSTGRKRGLMSGLILSMAPWAQATIAFSVAGLLALIGPEQYALWGWRLLFVIGAALSLGMFVYYRRQVADAPVFHRRARERAQEVAEADAPEPHPGTGAAARRGAQLDEPQGARAGERPASGLGSLLTGRWAKAFWQVFLLMTGLWLLTYSTVLLLTERLTTDSALDPAAVPVVIGLASVAQAVVMAVAGHLSTFTGRRRLFVLWGLVAALAGPVVWWLALTASTLVLAAVFAAVLQVITVSAYGPVSAYLSERFPTEVRSTGYGMGYSLSLVVPALYPFYLPLIEPVLGRHGSVMMLVGLGGLLLALGAALGPRLAPKDLVDDLDAVAAGVVR
ncbi:MFS transporter [Citricoccus sp.]|uniref:MFS transporter n=1 Tax=Citricoccus sp. TaxID=1978372 RepID=UPI0028BE1227|nr:MFS transporter [Citricoccus sp.]